MGLSLSLSSPSSLLSFFFPFLLFFLLPLFLLFSFFLLPSFCFSFSFFSPFPFSLSFPFSFPFLFSLPFIFFPFPFLLSGFRLLLACFPGNLVAELPGIIQPWCRSPVLLYCYLVQGH